ncbi:Polyketide synthase modules and related proteins [hydrothermal vent metagenome]|uniref:Polyketide synthase modules and related proteins n=1 Tax=hydrothermal vent metagenome TaxID=652676 RepID=A0A3B0UZE3_9ZZZZ
MSSLLQIRFERQASQTPEGVALVANGQCLTFAELNGRSNQLAYLLQRQGVGVESIVAVFLERSAEMVVALLAVLKAGAAYLPIDPNYPAERIELILTDAETAVCLTHSSLNHKLPAAIQEKAICIDQSDGILSLLPTLNLETAVQSDNLAYIIYTSGSTGKPKGVMITHGGLANYLDWALDSYPVQAGGAPVHSSISFDLTVTSLFLPLIAGQSVQILPEGDGGILLAEALTEHGKFGLVKITPAHLQLLNQMVPAEKAAVATRSFVIGGEQLTAEQLAFWQTHAPNTRLFNEYGPTETVVGCCVYEVLPQDELNGAVPIGQPIANTQLYVLDEKMARLPAGEVGELYIGGQGVARGYLKRPSLTAEKFVPDPFGKIPGARLYRTGDLVRMCADGNLEFLGRMDHQVKIRGYRIELGEIEAVLGQHENVRETAVIVQKLPNSKRLVAYLVAKQTPAPTPADLHAFLAKILPNYMIPPLFVVLERMPLTINGKIDRDKLPMPDNVRPDLPQPYTPPRTATEEILAQIWADVLGFSPIGIHDSFFELGGDSIRSIQLLAQAREAGLDFSLLTLFNQQTIAALAGVVELQETAVAPTSLAPTQTAPFSLIFTTDRAKLPPTIEDAYPLSKLQAGMLFHTELDAGTAVYHNVTSWHIQAPFDGEKLEAAVQQLAQAHAVLRTSFDLNRYSELLQIVWPHIRIPVQLSDLRQLDAEAQEVEIGRWLNLSIANKFDWTALPLLRFHFLQRSDSTMQMIMAGHHAILDGWSVASLLTKLFQNYCALLNGQPVEPVETMPYREFVAAEQAILVSAEAHAFWQGALAESSVSTVPRLPQPVICDDLMETAVHQTIIPSEQVTKLKQVAQQAGVPLKSVLLAAHLKVLGFVSGQNDVLAGLVMNGRPEQSGSDRALGLFLNTVPFRQKLAAGSWVDLIQQTFATEKRLLPHRRFPLAEIQQIMGGQPLFEVPFNYLHYHIFDSLNGEITILDQQFFGHTSFPLAVEAELNSVDGTLALRLEYKPAEFGATQIGLLAGYFERTLAVMVANPEASHKQFSPLSVAERQQLLFDWNATETALPDLLIHEWVAQVAREMPRKTAVSYQDQQLTYAQLNQKANQLAHYLRANGVGPETLVAVYLNRSPEMVIAALGVLKAGGAYLPLDPTYPAERLRFMLQDANASFVLTIDDLRLAIDDLRFTGEASHSDIESPASNLVCLDSDWLDIAMCSGQNPTGGVTADNAAYIIYTSGSTGRPKGVVVTHRGIPNMAQAQHKAFAIGPGSRVLQFAAFGFDASVSEIFVTLTAGATLVLASAEAMLPGPDLAHLVQTERVTAVTLPPSALSILSPDDFSSLQTVVAAGEACSAEVVKRWSVGRRFVNGYGPTEVTVCATTAVLTPANGKPHIGRPIDNVQLLILNADQQSVPVGTVGELYIGGIGVARGYLNRPELTAERFVDLRFTIGDLRFNRQSSIKNRKFYKTGDLVRYLPDGNIEFLGRLDHQVKIRGYRIELGEVEAVLRRHTAVQDVLLLAVDNDGDSRLVAYVVGDVEALGDLRPFLTQSLPAYMIPALFIPLKHFPLTPNGKIDRDALPAPESRFYDTSSETFMAPQDALESQLTQTWQKVLKLPAISTDANYFEIGGHSLQAVTLFAAIEKKLKMRLPLSLLFQAPTIAQLAAKIRQQNNVPKWSSLVPIQPLGAKTPFFCVHGGAGHVFHYYDLAQMMGTERPFYGLQPKMSEVTHQSVYSRVEEMAAQYIQEIKMVQPNGPYLLSGFCFGGIIAYEMAQQMTESGDEVGLLVFIDPSTPQNKPEPEAPSPEFLAARLLRHQRNMAQLGRLARLGYILNSGKNRMVAYWFLFYRAWLRDWRKSGAKLFQKYIEWRPLVPSRLHDFYFKHLISSPAVQLYHPRCYAGEAVLFFSTLDNGGDDSLGWDDLLQAGLHLHAVESTHLGILKRPFIDQIANKLNQHLEPFA